MRQTCIFTGSSHPQLVEAICDRLGQKPSRANLRKFANGETSVEIQTSVRNQDVFIVQSGSGSINDNVIELLIMIAACKGGSSRSITAVVPYFPYSRQSKQKNHRSAITARMLANQMKVAGVDHVITIDLHASQMQGFFKCPVDNLRAEPLIAKWIKANVPGWKYAVVVSKNPGGTKRVTSLADALGLNFGIVTTDQRRPRHPNSVHNSMYNSAIFEPIGTDGTTELATLVEEVTIAQSYGSELHSSQTSQTTHNHGSNGNTSSGRPQPPRAAPTNSTPSPNYRTRFVNGNGDYSPSPLANSTRARDSIAPEDQDPTTELHRIPTGSGNSISRAQTSNRDDDGYEDSEGDDDDDESARDVITGRLVQGHIVDDDDPSPGRSTRSASIQENPRASSDDEPPDMMNQSFISTTSERMRAPRHGLGGTGDAAASDEEEEEALQNPEIETTVTLVGNVRGRTVLIVDDMIDKAGSWIAAAETVVKRGGARNVYCIATHGLFGGRCLEELDACDEIENVVVTDAFPIPEEKKHGVRKLVELDVSGLLAEAIRRNHHGESISQLYQHFE